ncbi:EAL domain-containing protein [Xanthobacter flavus]|uniref:putative bifunctional diguanylate cyclase/phosphodiesterase n=1 Tax=Xanthobacter flavus TaxID=281 RepID=UPI003729E2FF
MYQESFLQELVDGILRSLFAVVVLIVAVRFARPRLDRCHPKFVELGCGLLFGVLSLVAIALPLPVSPTQTADLRVIPVILAAPVAGLGAGATAAVVALLGQLAIVGTPHAAGLASVGLAAVLGLAVAWWMGWRLPMSDRDEHPMRSGHLLALAAGTAIAAMPANLLGDAVPPGEPAETNLTWILHVLLLPGATAAAGALLMDAKRRRTIDRMLKAEAKRTATLAANIPGVLYQRSTDRAGKTIFPYMSPRALDLFGLDAREILADANVLFSHVHPDDRDALQQALLTAQSHPEDPIVCEFRVVRPDGRTVWIQSRSQINSEVSDQVGCPVAEGVAIDITDRKLAEAEAEQARMHALHAAEHDPLTGLPNRQGLRHLVADDDLTSGHSGLLMVMDLRSSKLVNDLFGSSGGDERLLEAARRLRHATPQEGIVARTGDDEFTIYLDDSALAGSPEAFVADVIAAVARPFRLSGQLVPMRADAGYVVRDSDLTDWESVVRAASAALEEARSGKEAAVVCFNLKLKVQRGERRAFDLRLAQAIDNHELAVFWQPICAASNGALLGREALVRWVQPDGSLIMPNSFIPRAEATGLWPTLDAYMLRRACAEAAQWDNDVWISVNMSPGWLMVGNLVDEVRAAMEDTGLPAERLCIEVTERALVEDHALAAKQISRLRAMGVSVAIDDFGTGYSSLSYLNRLPISKLKIDKTFIDEIVTSRRARDVVENIIDLCGKLSILSVAEGVETYDQVAWLSAHGCTAIQGYIFGRPERL